MAGQGICPGCARLLSRRWKNAQKDYVDFGFLHCIDEDEDFDELVKIGALDYIKELKATGKVRHIGFSSHNTLCCQSGVGHRGY